MLERIRLQKYLASAGIASRRAAEMIIAEGRVKVDGDTVTQPGTKVVPGVNDVFVDGTLVTLPESKYYYILYKPKGYLTSVKDPFKRPTAMELLPKRKGLYPVGRLDLDTEGLLLATTDGELAFRMMHPRYKVQKKYLALVRGLITPKALSSLRKGTLLEEGKTSPPGVQVIRKNKKENESLLEITLHEGKNRQIKRICSTVGFPVKSLKRTAYAFLTLEGLAPGSYRALTAEEVRKLFEQAEQAENASR